MFAFDTISFSMELRDELNVCILYACLWNCRSSVLWVFFFPVRFNIKYRNADIQTYTYVSSVIRKYPFHINNFSI